MKKIIIGFLVAFIGVVAHAQPVISNVLITGLTDTTATIQWTTDVASTSQLKYGNDSTLPYSNNTDYTLVTSHSMTLTHLHSGQLYYFAAVSTASGQTAQSATLNFSICGTPQVPVSAELNNYYQYGSFTATWIPPAGAVGTPTVCGSPVQQTVTGVLSSSGSLSFQVADASKIVPGPGTWQIEAQDAGDIAPITVDSYITQFSQELTSQLQGAANASGLTACLVNSFTSASYPVTCGAGAPSPTSANAYILSGCGVNWIGNLQFTVGQCNYVIGGKSYTSPLTTVTLPNGSSQDRIDVIGVDNTSSVFTLQGTPAVNPQEPTIDPATQLQLTFVYIPALATTPSGLTTLTIFDEGTEWTPSYNGNYALSTNSPYHLTHDVEATLPSVNNYARFTNGSTVNLANYNYLILYIQSKGEWKTSSGRQGINVYWNNGGSIVGSKIFIGDGQFGFNSAYTAGYQQVAIPLSNFGTQSNPVNTLTVQSTPNTGAPWEPGFYLDYVQIQGGLQQTTGAGDISGLTANYVPLAGSATTLTKNSPLDYGVTTASTLTSSAPFTAPIGNFGFSGTSPLPSGSHGIAVNESATAGTPTAGMDYLRADSTNHCFEMSLNGGAEACIGTGAGGVTSLNSLTGAVNLVGDSTITVTPSGSNIDLHATGTGGSGVQYNPTTTSYIVASFSGLYDDGDTNSTALPAISSVSCTGSAPTTCTVVFATAHGLTVGGAIDMHGLGTWPYTNQAAQFGSFQVTTVPNATTITFQTPTALTYSCSGTCTGTAYDASWWGIWDFAREPFIYGHGTVFGAETDCASFDTNFATATSGMAGTPTYLIMQCGQNDFAGGASLATVEGHLQSIWNKAHAESPSWTVVQSTMVPASYGSSGIGLNGAQLNFWEWQQARTKALTATGQYPDWYSPTADALQTSYATIAKMPTQGANTIFADTLQKTMVNKGSDYSQPPVWGNFSNSGLGQDFTAFYNPNSGNSYGFFDGTAKQWMTWNLSGAPNVIITNFSANPMLALSNNGGNASQTFLKIYHDTGNGDGYNVDFSYTAANNAANFLGFGPVGGAAYTLKMFQDNSIQLPHYTASSGTQPLTVDTSGNLGVGSYPTQLTVLSIANASVTGTTLNTLTKVTGAPSTAVIAATTDTYGIFGITTAGAGTTGNASVQILGQASCVFDGATTAGDYVQASTTTGGDCHDFGATYPTGGQVIGRVLSTNAATGTYSVVLFSPDIQAGGGSGVTWPASGDLVISNATNSPAGLAPVNGDCVIGSGGAWVAGSCTGTASNPSITIANAGTTGTTVSTLAKLTGAPSTAVITATTDTGGAVGIVTGGAGTTGSATITTAGQVNCVFSNATTAGDYVQISAVTAGNCADAGATYPTSGQVVGRVLSTNAAAGTYQINLFPSEIKAASGAASYQPSSLAVPPAFATFTWFNQGSATESNNGSVIALKIPDVAGPAITGITKGTAFATPWSVAVHIKSDTTASNDTMGIVLTDGTKYLNFGIISAGSSGTPYPKLSVQGWTTATSAGTGYYSGTSYGMWNGPAASGIYLRWRDDGTTLYADYSLDGQNWTNVFTQTVVTFITPTGYGVGISSNGGGYTPVLYFDGFKETNSATL